LVENKLRFEIRPGGGEFDFVDAITQVQALALFARRAEKACQPAAEIGGLADVRLSIAAQQEDCGRDGESGEEGFVVVRREWKRAREHKDIV
jgi:hypothetical protein